MERVPPFRVRVERKPPTLWAVVFIFLFFVSLLLILFLRSPLSHIETITLKGNQLMSKQEILQQSGLHIGISYFGIKKSEVEARLTNLPAIRQVEVIKQFPNAISIQVLEYPVVAYIKDDQSLIPLLANGATLISHPATSELKTMPIFEGWGKKRASFPVLTSQFICIPASIRSQIITIQPMVDKPEEVSLLTRHQHQIEVRIDQLSERMKLYPRFLKQPPGTVHLLDSVWFTPQH